MLDTETKSRIDSARDILVGKVPDPKSQVEQITIALIYKFMDDMDRQSEELGGKATFFTGDFKKYRWANLLDKRLGGHERLLLYAEGIEKMNENKNIPQLFRDIFKGVFLPYRDPETLNLFLKEINGFSYDHSERLGDAFEYLLSVLGTQGDAGQFRTPRHVIAFIVAVVDPKKHETVLDPACGTAGFLISAFKHILRNNENLTPDERARLMTNFRGYDIAPDMVRLSRANLYLHGFPNPVIHEYDTLTSEERWDERCDVILANPPFMSPKGGIRPHNRFSIKAKRSEVLFVDYMAEHLNSGGRAGIIVPEGIIFQSQNAYKALRKMLVENYLWAVVSLPAGVFNPYAGVKTCILFLDRNLARRTDELLFVKVESDGFDLGAQRRPNGKNDLPEALEILDSHKKAQKTQERKMALTVSRKRLLDSGDINLSGDRYRETTAVQSKWPMVKLGEVCVIDPPKAEVRHLPPEIEVSFVPMAALEEHTVNIHAPEVRKLGDVLKGYTYFRNGDVLLAKITPCFQNGKCVIANNLLNGIGFGTTEFIVIRPKTDKLLPELVYYCVTRPAFVRRGMESMTGSAGQQRVPTNSVSVAEIPLPPLEEQERIVAELDGYRKIIEGARQVLANYKPTIKIDPEWPRVELSDIVMMKRGPFGGSLKKEIFVQTGYKVYEQKHAIQKDISIGTYFISKQKFDEMQEFAVAPGDIIISCSGTMGRVYILPLDAPKGVINQALLKVTIDRDKTLAKYVELILSSEEVQSRYFRDTSGAAIQNVASMKEMRAIPIPLPPLSIQRRIVAEIEAERALVEANRKLIEVFEKKVQAKLAEVWGEEATDAA
jgi:type I restriction enzyme M protein